MVIQQNNNNNKKVGASDITQCLFQDLAGGGGGRGQPYKYRESQLLRGGGQKHPLTLLK